MASWESDQFKDEAGQYLWSEGAGRRTAEQGHFFRTQNRAKEVNRTQLHGLLDGGQGGCPEEPDAGNLQVRFRKGIDDEFREELVVSPARLKASIVICYNNLDQYEKAIGYIDTQSIREEIEIVGIDNTNKRFPSAAKALNSGASVAMGEIVIFMHQDLYLIERDAIEKIYLKLASMDKPTLLGVAGYSRNEGEVVYNLYEGKERIPRSKRFDAESLHAVETVDECFVACKKEVWERHRFDEDTCDNWHFYAVDLSYQIALDAGTVVVYPLALWHYSRGARSEEFYIGLCKMCRKYRGKLKRINSTCIQCRTTFWSCHYLLFRCEVRKMRKMVYMVVQFLLKSEDSPDRGP